MMPRGISQSNEKSESILPGWDSMKKLLPLFIVCINLASNFCVCLSFAAVIAVSFVELVRKTNFFEKMKQSFLWK